MATGCRIARQYWQLRFNSGRVREAQANYWGFCTCRSSPYGTAFGIAPDANLVIVRAFDGTGAGSYTNVITGLNWIVANKNKYNIRVLNLSFGAPPESFYWNDPLNQAAMAAWQAGIVVVASAGNSGPEAMTVGVPGNVPYIITAGAMTDNYTPFYPFDDRLASFSATGPTYE
jgi:serine protease AprX